MSSRLVTDYNNNIEVFFHGYQTCFTPKKWFCIDCFERLYVKITSENESEYLTRVYIKLSQFTDRLHRDRSNYCGSCGDPLYDIAKETCQHLSPTSNKWLQRFQINRHYGLRGGGTEQ